MKMFLVGGMVRDEIMGVASKDADFSVVFESEHDFRFLEANKDELTPFDVMVHELTHQGFRIFQENPEHLTVRAQFPKGDNRFGTRDADFVLARKEGTYSDGRRPDSVEVGTLMDDLARRDFTMNAIAKSVETDSFGVTRTLYIDPFNGEQDIANRVIRTVGDPLERFSEDALRVVRAVRFCVTKGFRIHPDTFAAMERGSVINALMDNIADERIEAELSKMFRFDTVRSLQILNEFKVLTPALFSGRVSLDSTLKTKGRGVTKVEGPGRPFPVAHNGCQCKCHTMHMNHISACCRDRSNND